MNRKWFKSFSWNTPKLIKDLTNAWDRGDNIALFNPALLNLKSFDFAKRVESALTEAEKLDTGGERKIILCTSGSLGFPKFVLHTESTVAFNINLLRNHLGIDRDYLFIGSVPLFHTFGLNLTFLNSQEGGEYVHMDKGDWNEMFLHINNAFRSGRKIFLPLVPQMVKSIPDRFVSEVHGVSVTGGDVLSHDCFQKLKRCFPNLGHTIGYGMTEAGPVITHTGFLNDLKKVGFIGDILPPIQYKLESGTLHFKSPGQALYEYINSKWHSLGSRWVDTGDIVESLEDGLYFLGRKKNVLKVNSEVVFPEQVLLEIKRILNVDLPMKLDVQDEKLILFIAGCELESQTQRFAERLKELPRIYRPGRIIRTNSLEFSALGKTTRLAS